jgi:hypothetical protein
MEFRVFPAGQGQVFGPEDAIAVSEVRTPDDDDVDVLAFTAPATGRYPIVVYRTESGEDLDPLTYHFFWSNMVSGVEDETPAGAFMLAGPYPNPVKSTTRLEFNIPDNGDATLHLYDISGRLVRSLIDGPVSKGSHQVTWDGRAEDGTQVEAGIYWARLTTEDGARTRKIIVVP